MPSINWRGEIEVNEQGFGSKGDTAPPEFAGGDAGSVSVSLSNWEPGRYIVMISKAGAAPGGGGDQNKEGSTEGKV